MPLEKTILRKSRQSDPFTIVPKTLLDDPDLSWKSKGILIYLLGKPDNWVPRVADIAKHGPDGKAAIHSALKELRSLGYAELRQYRKDGKITSYELFIADSRAFRPNAESSVVYEVDEPEPHPVLLEPESLDPENKSLNKKDQSKNDLTKKDRTESERKIEPLGERPEPKPRLAGAVAEIYAAYPMKVGRPKALVAIERAIKRGTDPETLLQLTRKYSEVRNGDLDFVPHPATWFNQDRFNDDPETWKPKRNGVKPKTPEQIFGVHKDDQW